VLWWGWLGIQTLLFLGSLICGRGRKSDTATSIPKPHPAIRVESFRPEHVRNLVINDVPRPYAWTSRTHEPRAVYEYLMRGREFAAMGTRVGYEKSLVEFQRVIELDSRRGIGQAEVAITYAGMARILREANGPSDSVVFYSTRAREYANQAWRADPRSPTVVAAQALVALTIGDSAWASTAWKAGVELAQSKFATPRLVQVFALMASRPADQVRFFRFIADSFPNYAELQNQLGAAYVRLGQPDSAEKRFRRALLLSPEYVNARRNLAQLGQSR
jgi:hypothetical protein